MTSASRSSKPSPNGSSADRRRRLDPRRTVTRSSPSTFSSRPAARPRSADIGLETIGLKPGDWLTVDDTLRVEGFDWLYATGDVNHRALLTHQGKYQARACGDVIAARAKGGTVDDAPWGTHVATADHAAVPQVTFSDPEVASVGMTSDAAAKAGLDIRVVDYDISWVAGASLQADGYYGQGAHGGRRVAQGDRRRHLRRTGCRGADPRRDHRRRRPRCRSTGCGTPCPPTRP